MTDARKIWRNLCPVSPEGVATFVIIYAVLIATVAVYIVALPGPKDTFSFFPLRFIGLMFTVIGAFLVGIVSAGTNHPLIDKGYGIWLRHSSWRPGMPLPLNKIGPQPRDIPALLLLCLLGIFSVGANFSIWYMAYIFFSLYAAGAFFTLAIPLFATKQWVFLYAVAFIWAFVFVLGNHTILAFPIVGATTLILARIGQKPALRYWYENPDSYPSQQSDIPKLAVLKIELNNTKPSPTPQAIGKNIGFQFLLLTPDPAKTTPFAWRIAISVLISFYIAAITYAITWGADATDYQYHDLREAVLALGLYAIPSMCAVRVLIYLVIGLPPISIWGRIAYRCFVVPRFDVILLGPVLAGIAGIGLLYLGTWQKWPAAPLLGLVSLVTIGLLLTCPPTRRQFALTAQYRAVTSPKVFKNNLQEQL